MNIIHKIKNIYSFNIDAKLLVCTNGNIVNITGLKLYYLEKARFIYFVNDEIIFILNYRNIGYLIKNNTLKQFDKNNKLIDYTDRFLLTYNRNTDTKAIFSIINNKYLFESKTATGNFINNDYLVTDFNSIIKLTCIKTGYTKINFSLSNLHTLVDSTSEKPYQVSEFCDIYKNTLISTMTNGDILLLDIEKGQEFKLLKNTRIKGGLFQKEQNSPIYIGLKFKTYIELNVEKGEIIKQIDLEEYFKQKFNRPVITPINTTIYKNGLIYFIADTNIVGIFNPDKLEVIDYYEFQFKNWQIMLKGGKENIQVKDNKIYCLDNQNNMYTLEYSL